MGARDWGKGWEATANRCRVSYGHGENILNLDYGESGKFCEYTKKYIELYLSG